MNRMMGWIAALAIAGAAAFIGGSAAEQRGGEPVFNPADFVSGVDHPYFPLRPGTRFHYSQVTADGIETSEVTVTRETRQIMGVTAVVVRDQVFRDGSLIEDTFDWYAQDRQGNVWYLGEDARQYEGGRLVGTAGSWEAGRQGASPGIIMKADPRVGDTYQQERAPGVAEDMAKIVSLKSSASVPYGNFDDCLETMDWNLLEPGAREHKYYARGIGLVLEVAPSGGQERLELTNISQP